MTFKNPISALLQAIIDHLAAVADMPPAYILPSVASMLADKVRDEVERGLKPPYFAFGPVSLVPSAIRSPAGKYSNFDVKLRVYAYSIDFGREQGWDMAFAAAIALHRQKLTLPAGFSAAPIIILPLGDVLNPVDAKTVFFDLSTTVGVAFLES